MASRDKVDVDTFHKGIQYALEKLGKSKFGFEAQQYQILKAKDTKALGTSLLIIPELCVLVLTKRHLGSGNEIVQKHARKTSAHAQGLYFQIGGCEWELHDKNACF